MTDITLLGHSAVQLTKPRCSLVIDPGGFSDLSSLSEAQAVLITHAHPDHVVAPAVAAVTAQVWSPADVIALLWQAGVPDERLHPVAPGDQFTAAGFHVTVTGGEHAVIHPSLPRVPNNCYLIDGTLLHPGDSLAPSDEADAIRTVLLPVAGPWMKLGAAIDFARAHPNARMLPIHDGILSEAGKQVADRILTGALGADTYARPQATAAV